MTDDEIRDRWTAFSLTIDEELSRLFRKIDLDDDQEEQLQDLTDEYRDEVWRLFHPEDDEEPAPDDKPADLRIYENP